MHWTETMLDLAFDQFFMKRKAYNLYIKTRFDGRLTFFNLLPLTSPMLAGFLILVSFFLVLPFSLFPPVSSSFFLGTWNWLKHYNRTKKLISQGWSSCPSFLQWLMETNLPGNLLHHEQGDNYFPCDFGLPSHIYFHFPTSPLLSTTQNLSAMYCKP